MTRKTIQLLSTLFTCVILAVCISGCDKSEPDKAADQAKDAISKSNRMIKASSDKAALNQQEMDKIKNIPAAGSDAVLNQQRKKIAEDVTNRITNAVGLFPFDDLNAKMEELKNAPINSDQDFENVCNGMIGVTNQIIEYSNSYTKALNEISGNKLDAALAELSKANNSINKSPTEQGRRNSLKNASNLALTSIYLTKARDIKARLALSDTDIHPLLLKTNTLIHEVRKCNVDVTAAKSSKPDKAIDGLKEQLTAAKQQLSGLTDKISKSQSEYQSMEAEYNQYMKKAKEFRDKYLEIRNQADNAEGSEKYKLQMEATVQRVGSDNMKNWAMDWIKQGKDSEMESFINSSAEITGGIHYETKAELVKLKMDSLKTQIDYFTSLGNNTDNRIIQLENVINKLETSPETTTEIASRISDAETRKQSIITNINTAIEELKTFEASHAAAVQEAIELYENAKSSLEQYTGMARSFGEFDPKEIDNILLREIQKLWELDVDFYNSSIGILDSIKTLPEMSDAVVTISDSFTQKASASQKASEDLLQIQVDNVNADMPDAMETEDTIETEDTMDLNEETTDPQPEDTTADDNM